VYDIVSIVKDLIISLTAKCPPGSTLNQRRSLAVFSGRGGQTHFVKIEKSQNLLEILLCCPQFMMLFGCKILPSVIVANQGIL
jgi:hypothetical protein